ncbi:MAG: ATP-binding protein [Christensenellaceae bacterium]|nr:ATP-binding protein [Christensenellaceae bacterium]
MAQVILLCGKICSGKSTYTRHLREQLPASAVLSCDELMLTLFPDGAGEHHDLLAERARQYQFALALELIGCGVNVILDWGFWTKQWREEARAFFAEHGIPCSLHYIDPAPDVWQRHIEERNRAVQAGKTSAYHVDEGLLAKLESRFEEPSTDEIDVRYCPD